MEIFFSRLRPIKPDVVTDHIESFTETGLQFKSGATLDADIIVTATGLNLQILGKMDLAIDNQPVDVSKTVYYKSAMFSDLPNFAFAMGYTNLSWSFKM